MPNNFTAFLWLLKLGAILNIYFLANTFTQPSSTANLHILIPARIFFAVSAYRCLFPVQYKNNIVFHNSPLSSVFLTRLLATFSEAAYIYLLSYVIRLLNVEHIRWVNIFSWVMVLQVGISQCFVWGSILTGRLMFFFYEEMGWAVIFAINTILSTHLYWTVNLPDSTDILIRLNILFGVVYLPWQFIHLRVLWAEAKADDEKMNISWSLLKEVLKRSIHVKNQRIDSASWGRLGGLTWMLGYWATLIPIWVNQIVVVLSR